MATAGQLVLAHHALIAAIPFLVPTLLITLTVAVMALQDRRPSDPPDPPDMETYRV
ncbi:MAG: hypothetical protein M3460_10055 [Actinomycetota bacterium]|nr:hypothetical protein [Actinomycetota bacterium]